MKTTKRNIPAHLKPLLATVQDYDGPLPPGDWTEGGKWRAITAKERKSVPAHAQIVIHGIWFESMCIGEPASRYRLYRVPAETPTPAKPKRLTGRDIIEARGLNWDDTVAELRHLYGQVARKLNRKLGL